MMEKENYDKEFEVEFGGKSCAEIFETETKHQDNYKIILNNFLGLVSLSKKQLNKKNQLKTKMIILYGLDQMKKAIRDA